LNTVAVAVDVMKLESQFLLADLAVALVVERQALLLLREPQTVAVAVADLIQMLELATEVLAFWLLATQAH
jgi:hypothetical protein